MRHRPCDRRARSNADVPRHPGLVCGDEPGSDVDQSAGSYLQATHHPGLLAGPSGVRRQNCARGKAGGRHDDRVRRSDFYARALKREFWDSPLLKDLERVVLVHRLREVSAQVGFTRFEAAVADIHGDIANDLDLQVRRAPLGLDVAWLPAVENRGEGIFIQFKSQAIDKWLKRAEVNDRGKALMEGFEAWKADHKNSSREFPGLPYYLLHSLSHLLMTAISLECGYPGSSIRERIYIEQGGYAILIYTASSDSEGTLGGLVLAGRDLKRHMTRALDAGTLCSNDPVCALHIPSDQGHQHLLGSACHGCLLISETSCEQRNDFLDRALVVATITGSSTAFFDLKG